MQKYRKIGGGFHFRGVWERGVRLGVVWMMVFGGWLSGSCMAAEPPIRAGFSKETMSSSVNRNDVLAAMQACILSIAREWGVEVNPTPQMYESNEEIICALRNKEVDVLTLRLDDYFAISDEEKLGSPFASVVNQQLAVNYVLLVRKEAPVEMLADLQGGRLLVLNQSRMLLADIWLNTELLKRGLPQMDSFFSEIEYCETVNLAILPVFFGSADGCIVSKQNFELACELNPQVARMLREELVSPLLIPCVAVCRGSVSPERAQIIRELMTGMTQTVAGRQLLLMFKCDALVEVTPADMVETRTLVNTAKQLQTEVAERNSVAVHE